MSEAFLFLLKQDVFAVVLFFFFLSKTEKLVYI